MSDEHLANSDGASSARRCVPLEVALAPEALERLLQQLRAVPGVLAAEPDGGTDRVRVNYDLTRLDYHGVLAAVHAGGGVPAGGRWQRLRGGLFQFLDENARANLQNRPACCSKPPPGAGRRARH